jgi:hypothetical protein
MAQRKRPTDPRSVQFHPAEQRPLVRHFGFPWIYLESSIALRQGRSLEAPGHLAFHDTDSPHGV